MRLSDQPPPGGADHCAMPAGAAVTTRPTYADQLDGQDELWHRNRRRLIRLLVAFSLVAPFFSTHRPGAAGMGFLIPATAAFIVMTDRIMLRLEWRMAPRVAWAWLIVMTVTAVAILAVGGPNWVNALVIAGAAIGRISPSPRDATIGAVCCVAAGLGVGLARGISYGNGLTIVLVPAMAAFFAYAATRRNELVRNLRETRAELARVAVADERLRIARDLHDLLGHSLSLITLKAELAGRTIGADPDRAAREIWRPWRAALSARSARR